MDPVTTLGLVSAGVGIANSLLRLGAKSGELSKYFGAVLLILEQTLENQLELMGTLVEIQKSIDRIHNNVVSLPKEVVETLITSKAHTQSALIRDTLSDFLRSTSDQHRGELQRRLLTELAGAREKAFDLAEFASRNIPGSRQLNAAVDLASASDIAFLHAEKVLPDSKQYARELLLDIFDSTIEVLSELGSEDSLTNLISRTSSELLVQQKILISHELQLDRWSLFREDASSTTGTLLVRSPIYYDPRIIAGDRGVLYFLSCTLVSLPWTIKRVSLPYNQIVVTIEMPQQEPWILSTKNVAVGMGAHEGYAVEKELWQMVEVQDVSTQSLNRFRDDIDTTLKRCNALSALLSSYLAAQVFLEASLESIQKRKATIIKSEEKNAER